MWEWLTNLFSSPLEEEQDPEDLLQVSQYSYDITKRALFTAHDWQKVVDDIVQQLLEMDNAGQCFSRVDMRSLRAQNGRWFLTNIQDITTEAGDVWGYKRTSPPSAKNLFNDCPFFPITPMIILCEFLFELSVRGFHCHRGAYHQDMVDLNDSISTVQNTLHINFKVFRDEKWTDFESLSLVDKEKQLIYRERLASALTFDHCRVAKPLAERSSDQQFDDDFSVNDGFVKTAEWLWKMYRPKFPPVSDVFGQIFIKNYARHSALPNNYWVEDPDGDFALQFYKMLFAEMKKKDMLHTVTFQTADQRFAFQPTRSISIASDQIVFLGTLNGMSGYVGKLVFEKDQKAYISHQNAVRHFPKYFYEPFASLFVDHQLYKMDGMNAIIMEQLQPICFEKMTDFSQIGRDIINELYDLHQAGYMHNDVKPDNIMQRKDGKYVLIDFDYIRHAKPCWDVSKKLFHICVRKAFTPDYTAMNPAIVKSGISLQVLCPVFDLIEFGFSLGNMQRHGSTVFPQINEYLHYMCSQVEPSLSLEREVYEQGITILQDEIKLEE